MSPHDFLYFLIWHNNSLFKITVGIKRSISKLLAVHNNHCPIPQDLSRVRLIQNMVHYSKIKLIVGIEHSTSKLWAIRKTTVPQKKLLQGFVNL